MNTSITRQIDESYLLCEMARLNTAKDSGLPYNKYEIVVFDETVKAEKNIPHFHFSIRDSGITIKIKLDNILALDVLGLSGDKTGIKKDMSNVWQVYSREAKLLTKWLISTSTKFNDRTNVQAIHDMWIGLNG
jgi:hypothetical protein